jgi:hypothetical protein
LHSRNTLTLARLLDTELPELGALSAKARLQTISNRHRITDFKLQTAKTAPVTVSLSGAADQLVLLPELAVEDIALSASASTADLTRLNTLFGWQNRIPAIGAAKARAKLSGNNKRLSISDVSISAGTPDVLLIETRGHLGTLAAPNDWQPQTTDLSLQASATGSKAFAKLLGYRVPELGPITASAKIGGKDGRLGLENGQLMIGNTRAPVADSFALDADLFAVLDAEPPQLSGKLRARNAFNPYTAERTVQNVKQKRESKGPVFSNEPMTFDWLNKVDLDLSLIVDSFNSKLAHAKSAQAQITQKSGRLAVSPATIKYPSGELELDLRIEARDRPRINFRAFGERLDPWQSLYIETSARVCGSKRRTV